jgi:hypothetical protein
VFPSTQKLLNFLFHHFTPTHRTARKRRHSMISFFANLTNDLLEADRQ